jgi:hypothetical protein
MMRVRNYLIASGCGVLLIGGGFFAWKVFGGAGTQVDGSLTIVAKPNAFNFDGLQTHTTEHFNATRCPCELKYQPVASGIVVSLGAEEKAVFNVGLVRRTRIFATDRADNSMHGDA